MKKKKYETLNVRITAELKKKLEQMAEREDRPLSAVIRRQLEKIVK